MRVVNYDNISNICIIYLPDVDLAEWFALPVSSISASVAFI